MNRLRNANRGEGYRWTMVALAGLAAVLWLIYAATGYFGDEIGAAGLLLMLWAGLAFGAITAVAWRRPGYGAALLAVGSAFGLAGLAVGGFRPVALVVVLVLGLAVPVGGAVVVLVRPWVMPEREAR